MTGGSEYRPESVAPMTAGQRHRAVMDRLDRIEALINAATWLGLGSFGVVVVVVVLVR